MAIECACPRCETRFVAPDHLAGRTAACPQCGGSMIVPGAMRQHVLLTPEPEPPAPTAQAYPRQVYPGQVYPAQAFPMPANPGQPYPAGEYPAQAFPSQANPAPQYPAAGGYPMAAYPVQAFPAQGPLAPSQPIDALLAFGQAVPTAPASTWQTGSPESALLQSLAGESTQAAWAAGASPTVAEAAHPDSGTDPGVGGARGNVRLSARAALMVFSAGSVALFVMIVLTVPKVGWVLSLILAMAGGAVIFSGLVWNNYVAIRESMRTALWSMLCPPYTVYFLLTRWDKTRKAFWTMALGIGLTTGGVLSLLHSQNLIAQRGAKPGKSAAGASHTAKREPVRGGVSSSGAGSSISSTTDKSAADAAITPAASASAAKPPVPKPARKPRPESEDIEPATDLLTPPTFVKPPSTAPAGNPPSK